MRIPGILALCLAGAFSLSAAGQSTAPPAAAGQSAPSKNSNAAPAAQNTSKTLIQTPTKTASPGQSTQAQKPEMKFDWPPLSLPDQKSQAQKTMQFNRQMLDLADQNAQSQPKWPQAPFDRGIYAGRNALAGNPVCMAIQSYNFSQGESPKLESITTCTTFRQPLLRNVRRPANSDQQGQDNQQQQSQGPGKDPK